MMSENKNLDVLIKKVESNVVHDEGKIGQFATQEEQQKLKFCF